MALGQIVEQITHSDTALGNLISKLRKESVEEELENITLAKRALLVFTRIRTNFYKNLVK
ncbi:MAG: hypothetical protein KatS3mg068_0614 [Candidatus Sericytochromatia bacterium]|nr:MAG: hypothetical protein KatS3mg068_0614 [Candidatus Sericytochromatia bacterium]